MKKSYSYEIYVEECVPELHANWFEGMSVRFDSESKTTVIGELSDQAALIGVLNKIQSLNLVVISVKRNRGEEQLKD